MTTAPPDGARPVDPVDPVDPPTGSTPVVEQDAQQQPQTSIARSSLAMASGTIVSRVLGVLRQSLIVSAVGVALAGEAFTAANTLPNVIYMIIAGGVLNSVLIPQLVKAAKNPDGGREFTDRILTVGGAAILVVTVVCTAGAALLMRVMTDFSGRTLELAVFFAFLTLPQIFFYGVYALLGQVLGARGRFLAFGWSPAIANVVAIAGLVSFLVPLPAPGLAGPVDAGDGVVARGHGDGVDRRPGDRAALPVVAQRVPLHPEVGAARVGLGQASQVARWAFAALAVSQVGFVVASKIMTTASDQQTSANFIPGVTVYSNALLVFQMPHSFVALSFITAMYPRIAAAAHRGDHKALRRDYVAGLTVPTALTLPMSASCWSSRCRSASCSSTRTSARPRSSSRRWRSARCRSASTCSTSATSTRTTTAGPPSPSSASSPGRRPWSTSRRCSSSRSSTSSRSSAAASS